MIFLQKYKKYIINGELNINLIHYGYSEINDKLEYDFWDSKSWDIRNYLDIKERSKNYSYDLEEVIIFKTPDMRRSLTKERRLILTIYDERFDSTNMSSERAQIMQATRMRFNIIRSYTYHTQEIQPTIGEEVMTYDLRSDRGFDDYDF